jgi:parvulin-like peptidyl-prolyl isomerase
MQIVAKVIEYEISKRELERECSKLGSSELDRNVQQALQRLIDRCLLLSQAINTGIQISDKEYDEALLDLIEEDEPFGLSSSAVQELTAAELETLLRRQILIKKYVQLLCPETLPVTTEKLLEFYNEHKEFFTKPERVHCAHILIRGTDDTAKAKAEKIRSEINDQDDFLRFSQKCSDCPSKSTCGDLGWFPKGKMIPEIDSIAFSMEINEISRPFLSNYGYHILMLLEKTGKQDISFEDIKDSLYARMQQIEREYYLSRHLAELRSKFASSIVIYSPELNRA